MTNNEEDKMGLREDDSNEAFRELPAFKAIMDGIDLAVQTGATHYEQVAASVLGCLEARKLLKDSVL